MTPSPIILHPILFTFPDWLPLIAGKSIHTYGALVATAFMMGLTWIRYESKRVGLDPQKAMDLFFYIVLSAIIGSRVLYVLVSVPDWWKDPLVFIRFWEGGLVFYGGLIGAVATSVWFCRKHRLPFLKIADIFAPGVALGHVFGRLGCFTAGCCYGKPLDHSTFYSIIFPQTDFSIAPFGKPLYATQLFEAVGELCIFLLLVLFRKRKKFEGEVFLLYIIVYPILRSILEIFRGDKIRGFIIEDILSTSQFISIIWVLIAIVIWIKVRKSSSAHN